MDSAPIRYAELARRLAARLGLEQYTQFLVDAQADLEAVGRSIAEGNVRLSGLQGEIDRINREIAELERAGPVHATNVKNGEIPHRLVKDP